MMDVEIVLSRTADLNCHRRGRGLLLSVQIPATMSTPEGDATDRRTVELCHRCDRDDPSLHFISRAYPEGRVSYDGIVLDAEKLIYSTIFLTLI
jgi:hypothetical protein